MVPSVRQPHCSTRITREVRSEQEKESEGDPGQTSEKTKMKGEETARDKWRERQMSSYRCHVLPALCSDH